MKNDPAFASYPGLTKLEWFTGMILQGLIASNNSVPVVNGKKMQTDEAALLLAKSVIIKLEREKYE